jgi:hypothetical protein
LAEHEVTRLISLVTAIAERMGMETSRDAELPELKKDVRPEQVLDKLEETERHFQPGKEIHQRRTARDE